jgi:DnaJ-class molecular chaperone
MSKFKQVILIQPPLFIRDNPVEVEVSGGYSCPVCKGNGKVSDDMHNKNSRFKECPFCKGTGKVKAVITTEWMPDTNKY